MFREIRAVVLATISMIGNELGCNDHHSSSSGDSSVLSSCTENCDDDDFDWQAMLRRGDARNAEIDRQLVADEVRKERRERAREERQK